MSKILIFGHKNPDTDSVCSSIVKEIFDKKNGKENEKAVILGDLNKETKYVLDYLKIDIPEKIEMIENNQSVIMVDHNEFTQSVDNIENSKIIEVIDHHRICDFNTSEPLFYRAEPVGCTATILYELFIETNTNIEKREATLMISAIVSDTLLLKSPTCTKADIVAIKELEKIAGIDVEKYGLEMLKAGTDLSDVPEEKLISLDAKNIKIGNLNTIIAQVNTASIPDMLKRKERLEEAIKKEIKENELDLFFLAITDIINNNSQVIVLGQNTDIVERSYGIKLENNTAFLPGIVSRKKQIIPVLTNNI